MLGWQPSGSLFPTRKNVNKIPDPHSIASSSRLLDLVLRISHIKTIIAAAQYRCMNVNIFGKTNERKWGGRVEVPISQLSISGWSRVGCSEGDIWVVAVPRVVIIPSYVSGLGGGEVWPVYQCTMVTCRRSHAAPRQSTNHYPAAATRNTNITTVFSVSQCQCLVYTIPPQCLQPVWCAAKLEPLSFFTYNLLLTPSQLMSTSNSLKILLSHPHVCSYNSFL